MDILASCGRNVVEWVAQLSELKLNITTIKTEWTELLLKTPVHSISVVLPRYKSFFSTMLLFPRGCKVKSENRNDSKEYVSICLYVLIFSGFDS